MLIQEFYSDDKTLKAEIYQVDYTHKVILYSNNEIVDVKDMKAKSLEIITDYCENFVMRSMVL